MKFIKQFSIIIIISFLGEILNHIIPLPVPASIYGLVIMFLCLKTNTIKLSSVRETSKFLIEIMPLMFIPAAVGLLESWNIIKPVWAPFAIITIFSTILVMAISGTVTQVIIKRNER
ncbi:holin-like protein [Hathewaya proteolytica DSM 3090]|uniref:Holin-like protein n=1 Tax=Hathewaya proteolytica DSM 3090 TaxID=1121331 RepID=A0A1M6K2C8_9CLOT|nr:CidA/LrgA family protein [Hathewaya proteolytica]SHJ53075.1 holin-like protein [Hathewaya proteolytica DSM 3090]